MLGRLASRAWKLGPRTCDYDIARAVPIAVADDITLVHDHYRPRTGGPAPSILVRTPYNRADFFAGFWYRRFAERGYHVIVQDCRGRFGSSGHFDPFLHEREDGLATIAWIVAQPWYSGRLGMWGASYNGFTQWAVADSPELTALTPMNTTSDFYTAFHPGGAVAFDTLLTWLVFTRDNDDIGARALPAIQRMVRSTRARARAPWHALPLGKADEAVAREPDRLFRTAAAELPPDDPYWTARRHTARIADTRAAVHLMSGWYDVFLDETIRDWQRLRAAGKSPHLTLGPFSHSEGATQVFTLQLGLSWFARHLKDVPARAPDLPVHAHMTGRGEWHDLPDWPPPSADDNYYLATGGALLPAPPPEPAVTRYRYDPHDPTPSLGGPSLFGAAVVDNRPLESRPDVRTFTGPVLAAPLAVGGPPRVVVFARSDRAHFDIFARLCEVDRAGRSRNVCDTLARITPQTPRAADGTVRVDLTLSPIYHQFAAGHRLRLQLSSGAHPRYARNPGTGVVARDAVDLRPADIELHHDATHPSALTLPVLT